MKTKIKNLLIIIIPLLIGVIAHKNDYNSIGNFAFIFTFIAIVMSPIYREINKDEYNN